MRDEGGGVGAPTVRKEKPLILQKAVSLSANLFLEMRFLNPPRVKLAGDFGRSNLLKCHGPNVDIMHM